MITLFIGSLYTYVTHFTSLFVPFPCHIFPCSPTLYLKALNKSLLQVKFRTHFSCFPTDVAAAVVCFLLVPVTVTQTSLMLSVRVAESDANCSEQHVKY